MSSISSSIVTLSAASPMASSTPTASGNTEGKGGGGGGKNRAFVDGPKNPKENNSNLLLDSDQNSADNKNDASGETTVTDALIFVKKLREENQNYKNNFEMVREKHEENNVFFFFKPSIPKCVFISTFI